MNNKDVEKKRRRNLYLNNKEEYKKERKYFLREVSKTFRNIHKNENEEIKFLDEQTALADELYSNEYVEQLTQTQKRGKQYERL